MPYKSSFMVRCRRFSPSSGIRPPVDPKCPPLYYFEISIFGNRPKNFLKAPWAPIYTNFEGGARAFWPVFQNFDFGAEIWPKQGLFGALGELKTPPPSPINSPLSMCLSSIHLSGILLA